MFIFSWVGQKSVQMIEGTKIKDEHTENKLKFL